MLSELDMRKGSGVYAPVGARARARVCDCVPFLGAFSANEGLNPLSQGE